MPAAQHERPQARNGPGPPPDIKRERPLAGTALAGVQSPPKPQDEHIVARPEDIAAALTELLGDSASLTWIWEAGYRAAEADMAEDWHAMASSTIALIDPESPQARESARRRILAAEEECRRDAREHWRAFREKARTWPAEELLLTKEEWQARLKGNPRYPYRPAPEPIKAVAQELGRPVRWRWQACQERAA